MPNEEHVAILKQGVEVWNAWRETNKEVIPDLSQEALYDTHLRKANLSGAKLHGMYMTGVNLREANLSEADLSYSTLRDVDLREANLNRIRLTGSNLFDVDLSRAELVEAELSNLMLNRVKLSLAKLKKAKLTGIHAAGTNFSMANLFQADLRNANLSGADFGYATLKKANLNSADLSRARFIETNLTGANLTACQVYGISAWDVKLDGAIQKDLIISKDGKPEIMVDNLKIAQFLYLLINEEEVSDIIDASARKLVLILGRFSTKRKEILLAIKNSIREKGYIPILFDFTKPVSRNILEPIITLASLSLFVIADITLAKTIIDELRVIIQDLPNVPVQPIILKNRKPYATFQTLYSSSHSLLPLYEYTSLEELINGLDENVIQPAQQKASQLRKNEVK